MPVLIPSPTLSLPPSLFLPPHPQSALLSTAYRTQADLEVALNVAKSNLQLVSMNNEMLEEALRRDSADGSSARDVGWRRGSGIRDNGRGGGGLKEGAAGGRSDSLPARSSFDSGSEAGSPSIPNSNQGGPYSPTISNTPPPPQDSRFFKFKFSNSNSNSNSSSASNTSSRASTPSNGQHGYGQSPPLNGNGNGHAAHHLTSSSMPSLPQPNTQEMADLAAERAELEKELRKQREEMRKREEELERERQARKAVVEEKAALEAEIESLSQALFEEVRLGFLALCT